MVGNDVDRAADGSAPIQGPLRATQDFDAVDVVELRIDGSRSLQGHAIDTEGHRRIAARRGVLAAEAAHGDDVLAAGHAGTEAERGYLGAQFLEAGNALLVERIAVDSGDGDRHLLHIFQTPLRSYDDGLKAARRRRCTRVRIRSRKAYGIGGTPSGSRRVDLRITGCKRWDGEQIGRAS